MTQITYHKLYHIDNNKKENSRLSYTKVDNISADNIQITYYKLYPTNYMKIVGYPSKLNFFASMSYFHQVEVCKTWDKFLYPLSPSITMHLACCLVDSLVKLDIWFKYHVCTVEWHKQCFKQQLDLHILSPKQLPNR